MVSKHNGGTRAGSLQHPTKSKLSKPKSSSERKREMYVRMFESMGIGDHTVVINTLVHKVRNNLTHPHAPRYLDVVHRQDIDCPPVGVHKCGETFAETWPF